MDPSASTDSSSVGVPAAPASRRPSGGSLPSCALTRLKNAHKTSPSADSGSSTMDALDSPRIRTGESASGVQQAKTSWRRLFGVSDDEEYIDEFSCAYKSKLYIQGRMYIFARHVCFFASVFGYEVIKILPLHKVTNINKERVLGLPTAITVMSGSGKRELFTSFFASRDDAYKTMVAAWSSANADYARLAKGDAELTRILTARKSRPSAQRVNAMLAAKALADESPTASLESRPTESILPSVLGELVTPDPPDLLPSEGAKVLAADSGDDELDAIPEQGEGPLWTPLEATAPNPPEGATPLFVHDFPVSARRFLVQVLLPYEELQKVVSSDNLEMGAFAAHPQFGFVRNFSFRNKIRSKITMGKTHSICSQMQRYQVYQGEGPGLYTLIFETSQTMSDIPYGDIFKVETQWVVSDLTGPDHPKGPTCKVEAHLTVPFSKKCLFKGTIVSQTTSELKDFFDKAKRVMVSKTRRLRGGLFVGGASVDEAQHDLLVSRAESFLLLHKAASGRRLGLGLGLGTTAMIDEGPELVTTATSASLPTAAAKAPPRGRATNIFSAVYSALVDLGDRCQDCSIYRFDCVKTVCVDLFYEVSELPFRDLLKLLLFAMLFLQASVYFFQTFFVQPRSTHLVHRQIASLEGQMVGMREDMRRTLDLLALTIAGQAQGGQGVGVGQCQEQIAAMVVNGTAAGVSVAARAAASVTFGE